MTLATGECELGSHFSHMATSSGTLTINALPFLSLSLLIFKWGIGDNLLPCWGE
jgi:hypothetical protein